MRKLHADSSGNFRGRDTTPRPKDQEDPQGEEVLGSQTPHAREARRFRAVQAGYKSRSQVFLRQGFIASSKRSAQAFDTEQSYGTATTSPGRQHY